jgi:hypothetical protein
MFQERFLTKRVDNSPLVVFRVFFGLLIALEAWGAIATGWVRRAFIEPEFTFHFIGFNFLQPLPGNGMYYYFAFMGSLGILIMLGYKYRLAIVGYATLWTSVYLMQKTSYNNHYYLLMLLLWIMCFLPAAKNFSLDAKRNPSIKKNSMPNWVNIFIILQLWMVYTYASVAKLYPDWLNGRALEILMLGKKDFWLIGEGLQSHTVHLVIAYVGILFDGLVVPALLWKRTRKYALLFSIIFHIANSIIFHIGIFPFLSLAFILFFYPPQTVHSVFLKKWKTFYQGDEREKKVSKWGFALAGIYLLFQLILPLRHWFIKDNVLWTEEGHRLSWRMMLRTKGGYINFMAEDKNTGERFRIPHKQYLSIKQQRTMPSKPDMIWQMAQFLKREYQEKGKDISIYANGAIYINGGFYQPFIDAQVDLTQVQWSPFKHSPWILPSGDYFKASKNKKP